MPHLFWDASGLTKRYALEAGTDTANALFDITPALPMLTTYLGYSETCASLRRKKNRGDMTERSFTAARRVLRQEVFLSPTSCVTRGPPAKPAS